MNKLLKIFLFGFWTLFGVWILSFGILRSAHAASPQFLVSWQAQSYVPSWYTGKIFPAKNSPVEINFEIVDAGRLANLSNTPIRWYINGNLVKNEENGLGIQTLNFNIPDYSKGETEVRITLPSYKGGDELNYFLRIPVKGPEVAIRSPRPQNQLERGNNLFEAIPLFWNTASFNNLNFAWSVDGRAVDAAGDSPWMFNLDVDSQTPSGFALYVKAIVNDPSDSLSFASKGMRLIVK